LLENIFGLPPLTRHLLNITHGAAVTDDIGNIGTESMAGSNGTVAVDGAGSIWTNTDTSTDSLRVGVISAGTLTVSNGGVVAAAKDVLIGSTALNSAGTVNIGAALGETPVAPGTLETPSVILDTGHLDFNHDSAGYSFDAPITGGGYLTQAAGVTALTAESAFTGTATVQGGTLNVAGSLATAGLPGQSSITVEDGATLMGAGSISTSDFTAIDSGGTLMPGDGTSATFMTVTGNLTFAPGANYVVNATNTRAAQAVVSGTASIDGLNVSLHFSAPPTLNPGDQIVLMTAATITGAPASATLNAGGYALTLEVKNNQLIAYLPASLGGAAPIPALNPAALACLALLLAGGAMLGMRRKKAKLQD
jgi:T5SS/PEP-CTERM-associated repeat protein